MPVCQAIQHAHQKGIIHRDIKPSNVLVTLHDDKPVPKVIDFGVAKAIDQRLTERTLFTQFGVIVGTPEYMSPEQSQMSGLDIDTRSDIYSLGVLLYELLDRQHAAGKAAAAGGGVHRGAAADPRGRAPQAQHAAGHDPGDRLHRRAARDRAGEAGEAGARRSRLDRDEGAREGPDAPLRVGRRHGARHPAAPGWRPRGGRPAVGVLPAEHVCAQAPAGARDGDRRSPRSWCWRS